VTIVLSFSKVRKLGLQLLGNEKKLNNVNKRTNKKGSR
jgi:hypothetical protein